jgi:hypothetical protein
MTSSLIEAYNKINFNAHVPRYEAVASQAVINGNSLPVDLNIVTFKKNEFYQNFGSGGFGLLEISNVPRIQFIGDEFSSNGDAIKDVITKYGYRI